MGALLEAASIELGDEVRWADDAVAGDEDSTRAALADLQLVHATQPIAHLAQGAVGPARAPQRPASGVETERITGAAGLGAVEQLTAAVPADLPGGARGLTRACIRNPDGGFRASRAGQPAEDR